MNIENGFKDGHVLVKLQDELRVYVSKINALIVAIEEYKQQGKKVNDLLNN